MTLAIVLGLACFAAVGLGIVAGCAVAWCCEDLEYGRKRGRRRNVRKRKHGQVRCLSENMRLRISEDGRW